MRARAWASGVTWPMMKPCEPPEKRPSVSIATCDQAGARLGARLGKRHGEFERSTEPNLQAREE
eukprot:6181346-Pleurochrysis_carterae.AAC.1